MARITRNADPGFSEEVHGVQFKDGAAEVTDEAVLAKFRRNPWYKVAKAEPATEPQEPGKS